VILGNVQTKKEFRDEAALQPCLSPLPLGGIEELFGEKGKGKLTVDDARAIVIDFRF
jgi:hypothetical protein